MLDLQLTSPVILIICAFIGGMYASFICANSFVTTKTMKLSLVLLPAVVAAALLAINGSLGTGIAILGVFGLVRFRSMPGSATDILSVFYAMVIGLVMSTGYIVSGFLITLLIGIMIYLTSFVLQTSQEEYSLRIVVMEDFSDPEKFLPILHKYCRKAEFSKARTTNMGSMYELCYRVEPKRGMNVLKMLDEIRALNSNLNVSYGLIGSEGAVL